MKKVVFLIMVLIIPIFINAEKENVTFSKCVDGDTIKVNYKEEEVTVRLLAIDTPETVHPQKDPEPFGKEASTLTCDLITKAKTIELEFDPESDKTDKYDRYLAWVYVDNEMLQKKILEKGYAEVAYLYGEYLYTDDLLEIEKIAKKDKLGIWSDIKEPSLINKIIELVKEELEKYFDEFIDKLLKKIL